ncbi:MAG: hypothetical protein QM751_10925 [Paludibacteraceae bacterium]
MNKDFLVVLLEKDIKELELLTEGFADLDSFPKPIIVLAKQKAENIVKNLNELEKLTFKVTNNNKQEELNPTTSVKETLEDEKVPFTVSVAEEGLEGQLPTVSDTITPDEEAKGEVETVEYKEDIEDYALGEKVVAMEEEPEQILIEPIEEPIEEDNIEFVTPTNKKSDSFIVIADGKEERAENATPEAITVNENVKINDIRQAINIGDRFRFQRELFGGNGEVMNKTIAYLNQLAKFEEVASFLNNKFGWAKDNAHAEDFLQIVKRKFL